ncbi:hypothetical protein PsYK624_063760 [Phanerochaete sordida]|uniref:Uncharacterized protein n=1 Tax=Phanerochaete sordida TaxID=48140 RepID=A0A9P3G6M5_9APHY|nr:hypothetical protein PsYK624_063760 [Phanerochaete sordida]
MLRKLRSSGGICATSQITYVDVIFAVSLTTAVKAMPGAMSRLLCNRAAVLFMFSRDDGDIHPPLGNEQYFHMI